MPKEVELKPGERVYHASASIRGFVHVVVHAKDDAEFKKKLHDGDWADECNDDVNVNSDWEARDDKDEDISSFTNRRGDV